MCICLIYFLVETRIIICVFELSNNLKQNFMEYSQRPPEVQRPPEGQRPPEVQRPPEDNALQR